jgi:hypothetical protein
LSSSQIEHLVKMANQIALNMAGWGDEEAVAAKTGEHIAKFWTADMRRQLRDYYRAEGEGLAPAVVRSLALEDESQ